MYENIEECKYLDSWKKVLQIIDIHKGGEHENGKSSSAFEKNWKNTKTLNTSC